MIYRDQADRNNEHCRSLDVTLTSSSPIENDIIIAYLASMSFSLVCDNNQYSMTSFPG
jgi:hypothetical protein